MKKAVALIIACAMSLALFGCSKSDGTPTSAKENITSEKESAKDTTAGEDNGVNSDEGAIVLLPGELYRFDMDADGGPVMKGLTLKGNQYGSSEFNAKDPDVKGIRCIFALNEWVEFYPDTGVNDGLWVYVYKHADDAKVYTEMAYTEEDINVLATCTLSKPEEAGDQWGALYVDPEYAQPGVYDIVFVKDGKAVAVMKADFAKEDSLGDKSDDELRAMMKDF